MKTKSIFSFVLTFALICTSVVSVFAATPVNYADSLPESGIESEEVGSGEGEDEITDSDGEEAEPDVEGEPEEEMQPMARSAMSAALPTSGWSEPTLTGTQGFVQRLYRYVLGREGSMEEIDNYTRDLLAGTVTAAQLTANCFFSPEFQLRSAQMSDAEYVELLYISMLNRIPAREEVDGYVQHLGEGASRNSMLSNCIYSPEYGLVCAAYGITVGVMVYNDILDTQPDMAKYVTRLYTEVLGRPASWVTDEERRYYVQALVEGASAGQLMINAYQSPEFIQRGLGDEAYVATVYRSMLGRDSAQEERDYYVDILNRGASRNYILQTCVNSPEFELLCQRYGMQVGDRHVPDAWGPSNPGGNSSGNTLTVYNNLAGANVTDSVENILVQIVYAEVGSLQHAESYKAQAIAAYSYILYQQNQGKTASLPLRTPPSSTGNMIRSAVQEVLGIYVDYNGKPAQTVYGATNNGYTNAAANIWGSNIAYLVAVRSEYDSAARDYHTTVKFTPAQFNAIFYRTYGYNIYDTTVGNDYNQWIVINEGTRQNGYVNRNGIRLGGGYTYKGTYYAYRTPSVEYFYQTMLGLNSPAFTVSFNGTHFVFEVYGHSHGVGMSQNGAYQYALRGWNYQQILAHYYPNTSLQRI